MFVPLLVLLVLVLAATGCGGEDQATQTVPETAPADTTRTAKTQTAQATTPTATTAPTATTGLPPSPEQQPGGAGDEEPARVPAAFSVSGGAITPREITVPAFLTIELRITARNAPAKVTLDAPGGGTYDVAAGGTARRRIGGLKPGDYALTTEGGGRATLHVVAGGDPGP